MQRHRRQARLCVFYSTGLLQAEGEYITEGYNSGIIILRQEHDDALKFIELALKMEPNNSQAKELKQLIQHKQNQGKCCWLVYCTQF